MENHCLKNFFIGTTNKKYTYLDHKNLIAILKNWGRWNFLLTKVALIAILQPSLRALNSSRGVTMLRSYHWGKTSCGSKIYLTLDWKVIWIIILQPKTAIDTYRWKKSLPCRIKCTKPVGIAVYLKRWFWCIYSWTEWFLPNCAIHVDEALDILSVLSWAHKLNLGPVDFELDSVVVDIFLSTKPDVRVWGYY